MKKQKCRLCEKDLPLNEYQTRPETGKRRTECRSCNNARVRLSYLRKVGKFKRDGRAENRESDPKTCNRCGRLLPLSEYHTFKQRGTEELQHRGTCKECFSISARNWEKSEQGKASLKRWKDLNADKIRQYRETAKDRPIKGMSHKDYYRNCWLHSKYGITLAQYDEILAVQDGKCAICGNGKSVRKEKEFPLSVDHDHETGRIRGLLCHNCNVALGSLRNSVPLLQKAITYLTL